MPVEVAPPLAKYPPCQIEDRGRYSKGLRKGEVGTDGSSTSEGDNPLPPSPPQPGSQDDENKPSSSFEITSAGCLLVVASVCTMSVDKQVWRRSPISPLAHSIRMDAVRQANIYPTCRLDKSSRAVYEPEDVWAKRAALVKPESRPSVGMSRARGMFKQKVLTISTTGVTKANMDAIDRVKEVRLEWSGDM